VQIDYIKKHPSKFIEGKIKGKGKGKKEVVVNKEEANPTCSHCKKEGHDDAHYRKIHPDLSAKRFGGKKKC
jgi:hypothetical protein